MKLKLFIEQRGEFLEKPIKGILKNRLLFTEDGNGDATIDYRPNVKGWTNGRFNIEIGFSAFYDKSKENYYVKASPILKQRILWQFGKCWVQQNDNFKWLLGMPISFALGMLTKYLIGC